MTPEVKKEKTIVKKQTRTAHRLPMQKDFVLPEVLTEEDKKLIEASERVLEVIRIEKERGNY